MASIGSLKSILFLKKKYRAVNLRDSSVRPARYDMLVSPRQHCISDAAGIHKNTPRRNVPDHIHRFRKPIRFDDVIKNKKRR